MIQGFVNDLAFVDQSGDIVDVNAIDTTHGRLTSEQNSYFETPILIKDVRAERLDIYGVRMTSAMSLQIDDSHLPDTNAILKAANNATRNGIFNIIEKVLYRNLTQTVEELDTELLTDTSTFPNYVPESLRVSTHIESVHLYDSVDHDHDILDWLRFLVDIGEERVELKFWINSIAFVNEYTNTTMEAIPPFDLETFIDPSGITDIYNAIQQSMSETNELLSAKLSSDNYTDTVQYLTKYVDPNTGATVNIPFHILYKGARPGSLMIRLAIKQFILASGVSDEDTWKLRLPDLFVIGQFFLIPMYDDYEERPVKEMPRSIVHNLDVIQRLGAVLYDLSEFNRTNHEILSYAFNEGMLVAVPDFLNQEETTIAEIHPTYQRYSRQDAYFQYLDDETKEFATMLNRAIAVASGSATDNTITSTYFDDREFMSFVVGDWEYHVITKISYDELVTA